MRRFWLVLFTLASLLHAGDLAQVSNPSDQPFVKTLNIHGQEPVAFIRSALDSHDLIVFDEGLHPAQEPWVFYQRLLEDPAIQKKVRQVFVEVISIAHQRDLDAFFNHPTLDLDLLIPVLQNEYSGFGWRYKNLQDFLVRVWEINRPLPEKEKVHVVGVSMPIFWNGIQSRQDYEVFQESLRSFDHFMYATISEHMKEFQAGLKGFFLTNTRHSYTGLRQKDGSSFFWNATTYLAQYHPGRVFSVRIHNVALKVNMRRKVEGPKSTEGLEAMSFRWVRMEGGAWDRAFEVTGNKPVALHLKSNAFGQSAYIGNQMLNARPGSTMAEAYDALVFLAPLEKLNICGTSSLICTPTFREELARRIRLLEGPNLSRFLQDEGAKNLEAFLDVWAKPKPSTPNRLLSPE